MIAFTYPGQGSQKSGMGEPWQNHPSWELVAEASDAAGRDVAALLLDASDDELRHTRNSQLATFVLSMVAFDAVARLGVATSGHAGHSLGEYTALAASGVLDFGDAVRLVAERGEAMQGAAEECEGTMAAVLGLDDEAVEAVVGAIDQCWVANYNAPGQVVIAGSFEGVEAASTAAKEAGAKRAMALSVGGAFHTPYMAPAQDRLDKALSQTEFRAPDLPVYANVDAVPRSDATSWQHLLREQLGSSVRWRQTLEAMASDGYSTFVEIGPGAALSTMVKRTVRDAGRLKVNAPGDLDALLEVLGGRDTSEPVVEGETLYATERLIVSPCAGVFTPGDTAPAGTTITTGTVLGHVADTEVRSPFAGEIIGYLAVDTERVQKAQPIAWLRTS